MAALVVTCPCGMADNNKTVDKDGIIISGVELRDSSKNQEVSSLSLHEAIARSCGVRAYHPNTRDVVHCEPKEETMISQTYESFLNLIAKHEVKKDELRFPVRLSKQKDDGVIFSHSFYISPNELRGFEIFIPKDCVAEKNGLFVSTVSLVIEREETKQGIRCLILKKAQLKVAEPNP